jgi:hypothetical protein
VHRDLARAHTAARDSVGLSPMAMLRLRWVADRFADPTALTSHRPLSTGKARPAAGTAASATATPGGQPGREPSASIRVAYPTLASTSEGMLGVIRAPERTCTPGSSVTSPARTILDDRPGALAAGAPPHRKSYVRVPPRVLYSYPRSRGWVLTGGPRRRRIPYEGWVPDTEEPPTAWTRGNHWFRSRLYSTP